MSRYCAFLLILPLVLVAGEIEKEVSFSRNSLELSTAHGYDVVRLKGCTPTAVIGEPELAMKPLVVLIPPHAVIRNVDIVSTEKVTVQGTYTILPVQHPPVYSVHEPFPFVEPNEEIYARTAEYPGVLSELTHTGTKGGYRLATITLYPLQYVPKQGELILYTNIKLVVEYDEGRVMPETVWKKEYDYHREAVKRLVVNPEQVDIWRPQVRECDRSSSPRPMGPTFDNPEYVIMVADGFEAYFEPLRDWKVQKGVPTEIVTRDWILGNYSGDNQAEQVRNFVADYHQNHGTFYFLCVGDWGMFPMALVPTVANPRNSPVPSDLYYQDYDEDLYSEVYVGRASVSNETEAQAFVNKVLLYEKGPPAPGDSYYDRIFLPAYSVFGPEYGSPLTDSIAAYDPEWWTDAKRYDFEVPLPKEEVIDSFNVGFGYVTFSSHGNATSWSGGNIDDADALTNAPPRTGIMMSQACMIGRLDYYSSDCYVEHMMNNPNGGTVAFWGNSRLGIGPIEALGRTPWLLIWFYDELATTDVTNIGKTCAASKDRAAVYAGDILVYHCMHEMNLFGDPEMPQWVSTPEILQATHDSKVIDRLAPFEITVTANGAPVEHAKVCLMSVQDDVYEIGYTDAAGVVSMTIEPEVVDDTLWVTVTDDNKIPYSGFAMVVPKEGPYVVSRSLVIDDPDGNGRVNPGEIIDLGIWAKNVGPDIAYKVKGLLSESDDYTAVTEERSDYGHITPDDSSLSEPGYQFTVARNCPHNHTIEFALEFTDRRHHTWTSHPKVTVSAPLLTFQYVTVINDDNGNGALEPGESADLVVTLKNDGGEIAENVKSVLLSESPYVSVEKLPSYYDDDIEPGAMADNAGDPFHVTVSSEAPYLVEAQFNQHVGAGIYVDQLEFTMHCGAFVPTDTGGYYAYYSSGLHAQAPVFEWIAIDSTQTQYPGVSLDSTGVYWWTGSTVDMPFTFTYYNQNQEYMWISPYGYVQATAAANVSYRPWNTPLPSPSAGRNEIACLWDYLIVSNPGQPSDVYYYYDEPNHRFIVEWFQVEHYPSGDYETFEIIVYDPAHWQTPTGDAEFVIQYLTEPQQDSFTVGMQNRLQNVGIQYYYDCTYHELASVITDSFAIKFTTYPPVAAPSGSGAQSDDVSMGDGAVRTRLSTLYPNPCNRSARVMYQLATASRVQLYVYDAAGRLVRNLADGMCNPGYHTVLWDGCDNTGRTLAAGIYFMKFRAEEYTQVEKVILLR